MIDGKPDSSASLPRHADRASGGRASLQRISNLPVPALRIRAVVPVPGDERCLARSGESRQAAPRVAVQDDEPGPRSFGCDLEFGGTRGQEARTRMVLAAPREQAIASGTKTGAGAPARRQAAASAVSSSMRRSLPNQWMARTAAPPVRPRARPGSPRPTSPRRQRRAIHRIHHDVPEAGNGAVGRRGRASSAAAGARTGPFLGDRLVAAGPAGAGRPAPPLTPSPEPRR